MEPIKHILQRNNLDYWMTEIFESSADLSNNPLGLKEGEKDGLRANSPLMQTYQIACKEDSLSYVGSFVFRFLHN